jgi:hypothetical protein
MINAKVEGGRIWKTILETFVLLLLQNNQHLTSLNWVGSPVLLAACVVVAKLDKLMDALYQRLHLGCGLRL